MADRISTAIAKARARREALTGTATAARAEPAAAGGGAWASLAAFVPNPRHLARNRIVTLEAGNESMPFDVLRTRLLNELRTHGWRRVAITSPDAGCGKSTLAANLAFSLARQSDLRSLLVEIDMRRPSLARLLGVPSAPEFARALKGEADPAEMLLRYGDNLALGINAKPIRGATEVLQGPGVAGVLDRMERALAPNVMLFDMPPMLRGDDNLAFLGKVDCALLVVEAEVTPLQEIDLCEQDLARHTTVLGVVINKLRHGDSGYSYAYGYD